MPNAGIMLFYVNYTEFCRFCGQMTIYFALQGIGFKCGGDMHEPNIEAVSYTHLTLPTIYSV